MLRLQTVLCRVALPAKHRIWDAELLYCNSNSVCQPLPHRCWSALDAAMPLNDVKAEGVARSCAKKKSVYLPILTTNEQTAFLPLFLSCHTICRLSLNINLFEFQFSSSRDSIKMFLPWILASAMLCGQTYSLTYWISPGCSDGIHNAVSEAIYMHKRAFQRIRATTDANQLRAFTLLFKDIDTDRALIPVLSPFDPLGKGSKLTLARDPPGYCQIHGD